MKKLISVQLDEDLLNRVRKYCNSVGATLSSVIRLALIKYMESNNA